MCDKLPYNNPRIDKCLVKEINAINAKGQYRSILSCCGHNKYPKSIVVKERSTGRIYEYFSKIEIEPKKRKRYYKRDSEGFYYIPEVISAFLLGELGSGKTEFQAYLNQIKKRIKK